MHQIVQVLKGYPRKLSRMNFLLFLCVLIQIGFGVIFIYGSGQLTGGGYSKFWIKQLVWISLGSVIMLVISGIDYRLLGRYSGILYSGSLALLIAVLIVGKRINGAKSWLGIAPGISLQPSEFAKLGLLMIVAWLASRQSNQINHLQQLVPFVIVTLIPILLIIAQPDLGSASVLVPITLSILFVSGIKKRWFVYVIFISILISPFIYQYGLADHQKKRLTTFLNPTKNPTGEGWNARQSLLAVGSGGFSGKGYMKGTQNVLGFLPKTVAPTDFIFSVIAEETGFLGSSILIGIFGFIIVLGIYIASKASDLFGRNLACGISILLCVHIYVNIGMTIGMAPIIGIPLPFVSYGGSFMILVLSCIGILQSVYINRRA